MKRLLVFLRWVALVPVLTLFLLFAWPGNAFAAWTITETVFYEHRTPGVVSRDFDRIVIKLACTSDAGATDYQITTTRVVGMFLLLVETDPGDGADAPSGTYTLDVEDNLNFHVLDLDARSTTDIQASAADTTLGVLPCMYYLPSVVMSTLGDGNKTDVYLTFVK